MIIHKCDKCGNEISGIPHSISYPDKLNIEHESVELCNKCFDDFKKWLKKPVAAEIPCNFCTFENFEHCPHGCFFYDTFKNECIHSDCQFSDEDGCCYFTLDCEAYRHKPLEGEN